MALTFFHANVGEILSKPSGKSGKSGKSGFRQIAT
jgi:hypothetical protein